MSLISVKDLSFSYPGSRDSIFEGVSFQIDTAWKLGFIGRNGRGKTTFLNLLLGAYEYGGSISASAQFEYFPFEVKNMNASAAEVVDSVCSGYQGWQLARELNLLGVGEGALSRPFDTLSGGERTKIMLAALFLKENSFLLIDEPTNHLDAAGRAIVSEYLRGKQGFILVSHDRAFLDGCVDHVLSINKNNIEVQQGNFSSWFANKEKQDSFEAAENEKLKKEINRLERSAREKAKWSDKVEKTKYATRNSGLRPDRGHIGRKAAKLMKRSKSLERRQQGAIEEKSRLLKNVERADELKLAQLDHHSERLLSLKSVAISYGGAPVCEGVSFEVRSGDRIALVGANGSGKSSVLKLICGEDIPHTGEFQGASGMKISYVSQDTGFLCGGLSEYARQNGIEESLFKAILRKLDFERVQFEKDMADFSGGQKKKVLIARSLCEKSHLLVWDEPLNFIDVVSRIQIESLLLEFEPTILFAEHDGVFCEKIANKFVYL